MPTPPIMIIGRNRLCPSACTAPTLVATAAMIRPIPMKAKLMRVKAMNKSSGWGGIGR